MEDLGWELGEATRWRDGVPRMVHTMAKAAAAGTGVADEEVDLLRVHLDTRGTRFWSSIPMSIQGCCSTVCYWPPPNAASPATQ